MKKFQPSEVMKVCDIYHKELLLETLKFIQSNEPTYRDTNNDLKEDLYNIPDILDEMDEDEQPPEVMEELKALNLMLRENEAGYLRIIYI